MSADEGRPVKDAPTDTSHRQAAESVVTVPRHPRGGGPYQLLPPLSDEEYAALREDIAINGVRVPVDVDEAGQVLDGHHRAAIAAELGIDYPTRTVAGLTEDEKLAHALAVNLQRRVLTREQRRTLIVVELRRDPTRSDRAIGRRLGVDGKTVGAVRHELDELRRAREYELAQELAERESQELDAVRARVKSAGPCGRVAWSSWIHGHMPSLLVPVMHGELRLADAAAAVWKTTGGRDAPADVEESAEIPHSIPLGTLGPYRVHPIADLLPIPGDTLLELTDSIKRHGLLHPIVLTADETTLVDGRIRYLACEAAGVEPRYTTLPADYDENEVVGYIIAVNFLRMTFTAGQRAAFIAGLPAALDVWARSNLERA